ncbi:protein of unknown function [Denitratisoma oestradiolicum]|uniref:Uncharacterized protein n=1 Tax=Denitratisoma oestradiolicum TaxID=311182 RepID=A0A6S6XSG5_9PROT|nr:protein of unknown function [Denitratisoma oestradiolicum]
MIVTCEAGKPPERAASRWPPADRGTRRSGRCRACLTGSIVAGCFHIACTETPEINRVAIAVLSVADSLAGLEQQYGLHYPFWIRDGISEVKISSVFTCV